jgi:hypothetical protein
MPGSAMRHKETSKPGFPGWTRKAKNTEVIAASHAVSNPPNSYAANFADFNPY